MALPASCIPACFFRFGPASSWAWGSLLLCIPAGFSAFWCCFMLGIGRALCAVGPVRFHASLLFLEVVALIHPGWVWGAQRCAIGSVRFLHFFCLEWGCRFVLGSGLALVPCWPSSAFLMVGVGLWLHLGLGALPHTPLALSPSCAIASSSVCCFFAGCGLVQQQARIGREGTSAESQKRGRQRREPENRRNKHKRIGR